MIKVGRKEGGGSRNLLKKKISEFGIDISHFKFQDWSHGKTIETDERLERISKARRKYSFEQVFCENSKISTHCLKEYIQRHNVIEYKCSKCGNNGEWFDGIISLEIHHINGDNTDNRITNLCYLCPNCHVLTNNYRGKNKAVEHKEYISDEAFISALISNDNIHTALITLGLQPCGSNYVRAKRLMNDIQR